MRLASGVYSAASGEKFTTATQQVTVPAGVTILGTYAEDFTSQLRGAAGETGLQLLGGATIRDLILTGFTRGIHATQGVQKLKGLYFDKNLTALDLEGTAQASLVKGTIFLSPGGAFPQVTGANVVDQAHLTVDGGIITGGAANCKTGITGVNVREAGVLTAKNGATFKEIAGTAVLVAETAKTTLASQAVVSRDFSQFPACAPLPSLVAYEGGSLTLTNAGVYSKGGTNEIGIKAQSQGTVALTHAVLSGHTLAAVHVLDKQKLVVSGSAFSGNYVGIHALEAQSVSLSVTGSTVIGNLFGIVAPSLKLRSTQVTANAIGVAITGSQANLGTLASPGNNALSGNSQTGVEFFAGPFAVSFSTISAAGNFWNAGVQDADGSGQHPEHRLVNGTAGDHSGQNFKLPDGKSSFKIQL